MSPENDTPQHDDHIETIARWIGEREATHLWAEIHPTDRHAYRKAAADLLEELRAAGYEVQRPATVHHSPESWQHIAGGPYRDYETATDNQVIGMASDELASHATQATQTGDDAQFGVTKGLAGSGYHLSTVMGLNGQLSPDVMTARMRSAGQEAGIGAAGKLEQLAPGASLAAKTGFELARRAAAQAEADLAAKHDDLALAAALDLIGRRTDIVAVQLPEPDKTSPPADWNEPDAYWEPQHGWLAVAVEDGMVDVGYRMLTPDQTRGVAATFLAAAARADAAEGEAK